MDFRPLKQMLNIHLMAFVVNQNHNIKPLFMGHIDLKTN